MIRQLKKNTIFPFKCSILIFMLTFLISCTASQQYYQGIFNNDPLDLPIDTPQKINLLQHDLASLSDNVNLDEGRQLAETSINYSLHLAGKYKLVRPPFLHNILVRLGIKDRGLCYQWTEDLMKRLTSLQLKSFSFHEGVAHRGNDLREHNTVVVTARGQEFNEGIVLDPWRNSGELYWATVITDRYPWEER